MSNIKHQIEVGNCEPGINKDIKSPEEVLAGLWTADSIVIKADSNTATADGTTN
jgi:hypothetical protein